ncbi:hypothetical protein ACLOJK_022552 [Asimina triloba]
MSCRVRCNRYTVTGEESLLSMLDDVVGDVGFRNPLLLIVSTDWNWAYQDQMGEGMLTTLHGWTWVLKPIDGEVSSPVCKEENCRIQHGEGAIGFPDLDFYYRLGLCSDLSVGDEEEAYRRWVLVGSEMGFTNRRCQILLRDTKIASTCCRCPCPLCSDGLHRI